MQYVEKATLQSLDYNITKAVVLPLTITFTHQETKKSQTIFTSLNGTFDFSDFNNGLYQFQLNDAHRLLDSGLFFIGLPKTELDKFTNNRSNLDLYE